MGPLLALPGRKGGGKTTAIGLLLGMTAADGVEATLFGLAPGQLAAGTHTGVMLKSAGLPDTLEVGELPQPSARLPGGSACSEMRSGQVPGRLALAAFE